MFQSVLCYFFQIKLCNTDLDMYDEYELTEDLLKYYCKDLHNCSKYGDVDHPVDLNLTILPIHPHNPPSPHAFTALYAASDQERWRGVNLTYVMHPLNETKEVMVGGLEFAEAKGCNYNGVPVLHEVSQR